MNSSKDIISLQIYIAFQQKALALLQHKKGREA